MPDQEWVRWGLFAENGRLLSIHNAESDAWDAFWRLREQSAEVAKVVVRRAEW